MVLLLVMFLAGAIGYEIAKRKGYDTTRWALACALLPLCIILLLVSPDRSEAGVAEHKNRNVPRVKCPFCAEYILKEAVVCRYCGRDLPERREEEEPEPHFLDREQPRREPEPVEPHFLDRPKAAQSRRQAPAT